MPISSNPMPSVVSGMQQRLQYFSCGNGTWLWMSDIGPSSNGSDSAVRQAFEQSGNCCLDMTIIKVCDVETGKFSEIERSFYDGSSEARAIRYSFILVEARR